MPKFSTPPPSPDRRPFLKPLKILPGPKSYFWVLSPRLHGLEYHWIDQQAVLCTRDEGLCRFCSPSEPPRWNGILAVMQMMTKQVGVLRVTEGAYTHCPDLQNSDGKLRGLIISAQRLGSTPTHGLRVELSRPSLDHIMPANAPDPNLHDVLCRLFRVQGIGDEPGTPLTSP